MKVFEYLVTQKTPSMKSIPRIAMVAATFMLIASLFGCGGTQSAPTHVVEDSGALIYDTSGVQVYADTVMYSANLYVDGAKVSVRYHVVSNNSEGASLDLTPLRVNGTDGYTSHGHGMASDGDFYYTLYIGAEDFGLPVRQDSLGNYVVDSSIALSISGTFLLHSGSFEDSGTFTATVPANFPDGECRTDAKWISTK